jgi:hypothetical protein
MKGKCGTYVKKRAAYGFGKENEVRRPFVRTSSKWKSNIKMVLNE